MFAISTASAQSNSYSNPSVIVDLSVLEKFGPPPTLPGLLRQGGQNTSARPTTRDDAAAGTPGRLLPPPSAKPQSHVTLPKANQPDDKRVAQPAVPRAKPKAALDMPEPPPAPPKADIPKKKPAPPPKAVAGTPEPGEGGKAAAIPPPKITPPPPPSAAAEAEDAKPLARQAEKSVMPKMTPPPPPPKVTAPPVPTATAEAESPAKGDAAPPPKVPDSPASTAMAPSATPESPPQPSAVAPAPPGSGTETGKDEEKQVAARAAGSAKVSADGKTIDILFPAGSSELPGSVDPALGELAQRLKTDESLRLDILGYAAGEAESASQARRLSLFRALAVRSHLMKQGILSTRMNVRALGNNVEGDAPADRVEIVVVQQ